MAARLNTRLIIILAVALLGSGALIGGFAYLRYKADATRNVRQGDAFMAKGEYQQALTAYGRAINKEPSNLKFIDMALGALTKIVPTTRDDLRQKFSLEQQMLERRIGIAPTRGETHWPLVDLRHQIAILQPSDTGAWAALEETAKRMADQVDSNDILKLRGVLYRAIGALGRRQVLDNAQYEAAIADLRTVIEREPTNDLAHATLIRALSSEVDRRRNANRNDPGILVLLEQVRAAKTDANAKVPKGPLSAAAELQELLIRKFQGDPEAGQAQVMAAADLVLDNVEGVTEGWILDRALSLAMLVEDAEVRQRATTIARQFVEKFPDNLRGRYVLVELLDAAGADADSARECEAILAAPQQPIGLEAVFQADMRAAAATKLFDLEFKKLVALPAADQPAQRAVVEAALKRLRDEREDPETDLRVLRSQARLAAAMLRWNEALGLYERYIRLIGEAMAPPDVLFETAIAAAEANELGLARRRIEQSIASNPRNINGLILKASLEQRAGDHERAGRTLSLAEQVAPNDPRIAPLKAANEDSRGDDPIARQLLASQQRFDSGDVAGAAMLLDEALKRSPSEPRLVRARAYMALLQGKNERAAELARQGLVAAPDDEFLKKALLLAETTDQVERVIRSIEADTPEGPDRVARTYRALTRTALERGQSAETLAAKGESDRAAQATADAAKLEAAAARYAEMARALQPPHPLVIQTEFDLALAKSDLDAAKAILDAQGAAQVAGTSPLTAVDVAAMRARFALVRADKEGAADLSKRRPILEEAVRELDASIQRNPESTELQVLRGRVQSLLGNVAQSVDALASAYAQRPNDMAIVESYAAALQAAGEQQRMLQVLRDAARQQEVTTPVRSLWLAAEAIYGDRRVALRERRALYAASPEDLVNGVALAALYMTLPPARELMLDGNGRERVPTEAWATMSPEQQRAALDLLRREWFDEADRMLNDLGARSPDSLEIAVLRADLARARGTPEKGEAALRDAIKKAGDKASIDLVLALGGYLLAIGKPDQAGPVFDQALRIQGPRREADRYLATVAMQRNDPALAAKHLRSVAEGSHDLRDELSLVEALARSGQVDEADRILKATIAANGPNADAAMMQATVASAQLDAALRAGGDASALERTVNAALQQAQQLRPTDPAPLVGQAQLLVGAWQRRADRSATDAQLDEALSLLDRATTLRADYWPASRLRAQILNARGDSTRARLELERLLKVSPLNDDARGALIELWSQSRAFDKAVALAREGADLRPVDPRWQRILGDLMDRSNNIPGAVTAHRRALELEPGGTPERLVMLMLKSGPNHPPEYAAVVKLLQDRRPLLDRSAYLRAAYGAALANTGKRADGLDQLTQAYAAYQPAVKEQPDVINGWYDQLWLVFPSEKTADAEQFVRRLTDGKLGAFDLRELGLRYAELGASGAAKAVDLLKQAAAASGSAPAPQRAMVLFDLGAAMYAAGDAPGAIQMLEQGLALKSDNPGIHNNLAYLYLTIAKDPSKALPHAEKAVAIAPGVASFHDTLGIVLEQLGQIEAAERELRKALAIEQISESRVNLARVLSKLNRAAEARAELRRAGDADPAIRQSAEFKSLEAQLGK